MMKDFYDLYNVCLFALQVYRTTGHQQSQPASDGRWNDATWRRDNELIIDP